MYIKFLNSKQPIKCAVSQVAHNIINLKFAEKIIVNQSGFRAYADENCEYDIGGDAYLSYTTMYRNDESTVANNGYQLSNDGSVYIAPLPKVFFSTNGGGNLDGETVQEVTSYGDLVIPTPVAYEGYEFTQWSPEIPESGKIEENKSFMAIFTSTLPEPEPEPTLEEEVIALKASVAELKSDVAAIDTVLKGGTSNE